MSEMQPEVALNLVNGRALFHILGEALDGPLWRVSMPGARLHAIGVAGGIWSADFDPEIHVIGSSLARSRVETLTVGGEVRWDRTDWETALRDGKAIPPWNVSIDLNGDMSLSACRSWSHRPIILADIEVTLSRWASREVNGRLMVLLSLPSATQ